MRHSKSSIVRDTIHDPHSVIGLTTHSGKAFHTDSNADILAFQTRGSARRGGSCVLSSGHSIYNELATTRPDVIRTLALPNWPFAL